MDYRPNFICFDQVCRICMKSSTELQSIFGHPQNIPELILLLSKVEVSFANFEIGIVVNERSLLCHEQVVEDDVLPKQICSECLIFAGNAAEFKERCIQSNRTLREYIAENVEDRKQYVLKEEPDLVGLEDGNSIPLGPEFIKCEIDESSSEKPDEGGNDFEIADGIDSVTDEEDNDQEEEEEMRIDRRIRRRRTRNPVIDDSDDEPLISKKRKGDNNSCTMCEEKFRNKAHIKFHMRSDHADEKTPKEDKLVLS